MMRGGIFSKLLIVGQVVTSTACVEPYQASYIAEDLNILVVDGFMDATRGSATVRLSHVTPLSDEEASPAEKGAMVTIRSETGDSFALIEQDSGKYFVDALAINPSSKYQLYITTSDGEEYISDAITITHTPPIDSITWRQQNDGLVVLANTHDVMGNSKYYRWDYVETWEYHTPFGAYYKLVDHHVEYRQPDEFVFACFNTVSSTNILLSSSERLNEDVIHDFPVVFIPRESNRISVMYSIKVRQRVIDEAEYEFWKDLQRVTESVGGLFDSQPYEIVGNVHQVSNPSTPVMGYFSGGTIAEERIFIDYHNLPHELQLRPFHGCVMDTVCLISGPGSTHFCSIDVPNLPANAYLVDVLTEDGIVWGFTMATPPCADCRLQGGTLTKPAFWP